MATEEKLGLFMPGSDWDYLGLPLHILHLSVPEISAFLDGEPVFAGKRVKWHLGECLECRAIAEHLAYIHLSAQRSEDQFVEELERPFNREGLNIWPQLHCTPNP